ncbi:peptide deformylase [Mycoplasmoides fastidiosum]|uniref:Peptide deformylase n=1 Tax=Mycoplasmoides fastidiosum TaxID=92758 RepID=A0ABU0LYP2_9BACT|nr:peptide deformylase [Mycoplasmoides fastidiosum]MDQ0513833.1 peptide deformylase [Mycoplasmoides fastidiosum]UUD37751.1 peptide deformylase [Mycoplasmoides fastidiosum]
MNNHKKLIPNNNWLAIDPADVLRVKCNPVTLPLSNEHLELIAKMQAFIDSTFDDTADQLGIKKGIAIAAPQLGVPVRIMYIHFREYLPDPLNEANEPIEIEHKYLLANPVIVSESLQDSYLSTGEGCLSVETKYEGYVYRKKKIIVKAFNLFTNQDEQYAMDNFLSICFQHEFDHLNGVLYYDRISKTEPFKVKEGAFRIE